MTDDDTTDDDADRLNEPSDKTLDHEASCGDLPLQDGLSDAADMHANHSHQARRRELELQLQKIRSEASAARLDAKAAEIELMIRRLSAESFNASNQPDPPNAPTQPSSKNVSPADANRSDSGGTCCRITSDAEFLCRRIDRLPGLECCSKCDGFADRCSTTFLAIEPESDPTASVYDLTRLMSIPSHHLDSVIAGYIRHDRRCADRCGTSMR